MIITGSEDFDIRYTTLNDMEVLRQWLKFEGILYWFPPSDDLELENFIRIWMGFIRYNACLTAVYKEKPVGMAVLYLMPYRKVAHHAMFQMIVNPEHLREGVGTSLVRNLKHLAKNTFHQEMLYGEILGENPILNLLRKLDFFEFARQEKYVKEGAMYCPRILIGVDL